MADLTSLTVAEIKKDRAFDSPSQIRYLTYMNDVPQDAWFYTCKGERIGPVTFADLRIKAQEATLNPRLDMAWTQGMEAWKPSGEIEGLFERRTSAEPQESLAPSADPYAPPKGESAEEKMAKESGWPGYRRRAYLFFVILFPAAWGYLAGLATPMMTQQFGEELMKVIPIGVKLLPSLVIIYISLKRLMNVGMSRWWILGNVVPILNLWVGYRCFACPGGYAYHKKMDGVGIFLAIIYWFALVVSVVMIGVLIAIFLGYMGSPEMKQQIKELIEMASKASARP